MSVTSRIPVGKFGWLVVAAVLASPLLFFALVTPKEKPVSEPTKIELPPSKLAALGLRENRDWDGLPEMFAVWAGELFWENDKTYFGYWNPGSNTYSYVFEADRRGGSIKFRALGRREREQYPTVGLINENVTTSETHPFVFPAMSRVERPSYWPLPSMNFGDVPKRPKKIELKSDEPRDQ